MMKVTLGSLAAALCLALTGPAAFAGDPIEPDSTHYWTWTIEQPLAITAIVQVRDQFTQTFRPLDFLVQRRLLNPAIKRHNNQLYVPGDTTLHLTWWDVRPTYRVNEPILFYDQFYPTGAPTVVDTLAFMLVPASKTRPGVPPLPPPPPGAATHYLCYRILAPPPNVTVTLADQFRTAEVTVLEARYFCAPCFKQHGAATYPPADDRTHLVLYRVVNPFTIFPVLLWDQFAQRQTFVFQTPDEYLVVPALKEHIPTPTRQSSWGRLKSLYR
jgi:hypothetical protein